jgi:hypothetical protein
MPLSYRLEAVNPFDRLTAFLCWYLSRHCAGIFFRAGFQLHGQHTAWRIVSRQHVLRNAMRHFYLLQKDFSLLAIIARIISPAFSA